MTSHIRCDVRVPAGSCPVRANRSAFAFSGKLAGGIAKIQQRFGKNGTSYVGSPGTFEKIDIG